MLRDLIRSALLDTASLLQWAIEFLTPDDPTPLGVLRDEILTKLAEDGEEDNLYDIPAEQFQDAVKEARAARAACEDCDGICGVCQTLNYYAGPASGFDGGSVYHARADRE